MTDHPVDPATPDPTTPDPTTLATVWHSMQTTCREMRHLIDRTAQNALIAQLHDLSVGIWSARGDTIAVPEGLPGQFLGAQFGIRAIVEKFGGDVAPGDVYLTNDPYKGHRCHPMPEVVGGVRSG